MTSGHRRYEEGGGDRMAQEPGGKTDPAHIAFRQGIVYEPDIRKTGIAALDRFLCADPQVIQFPR
jgi:hypothetical protein